MLRCTLIVFCFMIFSSSLASYGNQSTYSSETYFPLQKGNYWIYQGKTSWTLPNSNKTKTKVLTWKMEVIDTCKRGHLFAALLKGHPEDLAWYEADKKRGDYLILRIGSSSYHLIHSGARKFFQRLKNPKDGLFDITKIIGEDTLFIEAPLVAGKIYGEWEQVVNRGNAYCWQVLSEGIAPRSKIKGVSADPRMSFRLTFQTNPDHQTLDFVPTLGIVYYEYVHHGTVSETYLKLIKFGRSK